MVPLRIDPCEDASGSRLSQRPRLVLQDTTAARAPSIPTARAAKRKTALRWDNLLFAAAAVAVVLFFLASFAASLFHSVQAAYAPSLSASAPTIHYTVKPGDTLWKLAARYGDPNSYMLDRVETLARDNRLSSNSPLVPGQRLLLSVRNPQVLAKMQSYPASVARR